MTVNTPKTTTTFGHKDWVWKCLGPEPKRLLNRGPDLDPESPGERAEGYLFRGTLRLDFDEWPMADGHSASHATNPGVMGGNVLLGSLGSSHNFARCRRKSGECTCKQRGETCSPLPSRIFAVFSLAQTSSCKFGFLYSSFKQYKFSLPSSPKVIFDWLKRYFLANL